MNSLTETYLLRMLDGPIPTALRKRVDRLDRLISKCAGDGQMVSRQVLAVVVEAYEREVADAPPVPEPIAKPTRKPKAKPVELAPLRGIKPKPRGRKR